MKQDIYRTYNEEEKKKKAINYKQPKIEARQLRTLK